MMTRPAAFAAGLAPFIQRPAPGRTPRAGRGRLPRGQALRGLQFGWRDRTESATPIGDGITTPSFALIGICRDRAKAERIAARIRRAGRRALEQGVRPHQPVVGRAIYDPFLFVAPPGPRPA